MSDPARPALLFLVERFPPDLGGVARSAHRTAAAIAQLGWDVHVVAWTRTVDAGGMVTEQQDHGVFVHRVGLFSNWDYSMQHSLNVLEWLHEEREFTAVWGHYLFPAGYLAVLFARMQSLPCTVSARGNDIDRLMFPPGDFSRLHWTLEHADLVTCVSAELQRKINVLVPAEKARVMVLGNVVDSETFQRTTDTAVLAELRGRWQIEPDEVVLGFCGELRHKKGLPFLLTALAEIRTQHSACLLVIGAVRPRERAQLTTFAAEHPEAAERILVTGHLEEPGDVAQALSLCDIVLQPSVWDGMPNSVLEAMACGCLVIGSDAGGIPEIIDHGQTGFLVPRSRLNHLATAVHEVLALSRQHRRQIGQQAADSVRTHFHADRESRRLADVMRQLGVPAARLSQASGATPADDLPAPVGPPCPRDDDSNSS